MGRRLMRILVTGSRDWNQPDVIARALLDTWLENDRPNLRDVILVEGGCPTGADAMARVVAVRQKMTVESYPADWNKYGRRSGWLRNKEMVSLGADVCLAFIRNESKGATMTVRLAEKAGIPVKCWRITE
jgi:hypothetical protein